MKKTLFFLIIAVLCCIRAIAITRYVDYTATGINNGSSWTNAYKTLSQALADAQFNASIDNILLAKGTYYPTGTQSATNRDSSFCIYRGGLRLYGGYPNGGGTRDSKINPTIFSGDIGTLNNDADNSYHVVLIVGLPAVADSVIIDGCTITSGEWGNGIVTYNSVGIDRTIGAGIQVNSALNTGKVKFSNCIVSNNSGVYAGGMYSNNASVLIDRCIFSGNDANFGTGALQVNTGNPVITNSVFSGNLGLNVGSSALSLTSANATIINSTFAGNQCALTNQSAAIFLGSGSIVMRNSIVFGNNKGIQALSGNSVIISNSLVQDSTSTANGNLDASAPYPIFVAPVAAALAPTTAGDYRLSPASRCINTGSNTAVLSNMTTDLAGNTRIVNGRVDMGAYETYESAFHTLYVDRLSGIYGNGGSWASPLRSLPEATVAAMLYPNIDSILVAEGDYYPMGSTPNNSNLDTTFGLYRGGLKLLGGYPTGGGTRDPTSHYTTLTGATGVNNTSVNHVMVIAGLPANADSLIVDGFGITNGKADQTGSKVFNGQLTNQHSGGGIYMTNNANGGKLQIRNTVFGANRAHNTSGAPAWTGGGAMYIDQSNPVVSNCQFYSNTTNGGAGSAVLNHNAAPVFNYCYFSANLGNNGGTGAAIFNDNSTPVINNCELAGNTGGSGTPIYNRNSTVTLNNTLIQGNVTVGGLGNGMYSDSSYVTMNNCTVVKNNGTFSTGSINTNKGALTLHNTIIYGNSDPLVSSNGALVTSSNSLIQGDASTANGNFNGLTTDPNFVFYFPLDISNPNPQDNGDYRLTSCSPLIDKGSNTSIPAGITTDYDHNARIIRGTVDLGAYEDTDAIIHRTLYVDSAIVASGNGYSWSQAFKTLSDALSYAGQCGAIDSVLVAKGTYYPTGDQSGTDRDNTFAVVSNTLKLIGGYPNGGGARNLATNQTILSGDIGTANDITDNSYHLMVIINQNYDSDSLVVDGFTFTGANANGVGAKAYGDNVSVPRNAGGGIVNRENYGKVLFLNCTVAGNKASSGGGIYNNVANGTSYVNTVISGNDAPLGSGAININCTPSFINCTIAGNKDNGSNSSGSIYNSGGNASAVLTNTIVYGNSNGIYTDLLSSAVNNSLVQGATGTTSGNYNGNTTNPSFLNALSYTLAPTLGGDYRIAATSPCNNSGNPYALPISATTDRNGNNRFFCGLVDMGAYQNTACLTAHILYVDSSAAFPGNGSSWSRPVKVVSQALALANTCMVVDSVLVAKGTYYPTGFQNGDNRDSSFIIYRGGLKVLGGYPSGGGTRNIQANTTLMSGNIGAANTNADNSYHVLAVTGIVANADSLIIDGFTISGGNANGSGSRFYNGQEAQRSFAGGIFTRGLFNNGKVRISNNIITSNASTNTGSGMYNENGTLLLANNSFITNTGLNGGGLANAYATPVVINCDFRGNSVSGNGGGILDLYATPTYINCVSSGNYANFGGGIYQYFSSPTLINCTVAANNAATGNGGGMYITSTTGTVTTIRNSVVALNNTGILRAGSTTDASYSLLQGESSTANGNVDGNLNPGFQNPIGYLSAPMTIGVYSPAICSPLINKGSNQAIPASVTTDINNATRIQDGLADIGAYEQSGFKLDASPSSTISYNNFCQSGDGWLHLYNNTGSRIIVSVKNNGQSLNIATARSITNNKYGTGSVNSFNNAFGTTGYLYPANRGWAITINGTLTGPVNVRFYFSETDSADLAGQYRFGNLRNLHLYKVSGTDPWNVNATGYIDYTYGASPGLNTFTLGTYQGLMYAEFQAQSFSAGSLAMESPIPLPLELLSFTGQEKSGAVQLQWQTANEQDAAYFDVERSTDGKDWMRLHTVNAKGSGNNLYGTIDDHPASGDNYYRLRIADKNGQAAYSNVVRVLVTSRNQMAMQVYPNPSAGIFTLDVQGLNGTTAQVVITDAIGQVVQRTQILEGRNQVDAHQLAAGVYTMSLTGRDSRLTQQLVIVAH